MVMKTIPPETMQALTKSVENVSSPTSDDINNVINTLKNSNSPLGEMLTDEKISQISTILPQMTSMLSSLNIPQLAEMKMPGLTIKDEEGVSSEKQEK
jgi:uncharacterized phage protein gp47/JayE